MTRGGEGGQRFTRSAAAGPGRPIVCHRTSERAGESTVTLEQYHQVAAICPSKADSAPESDVPVPNAAVQSSLARVSKNDVKSCGAAPDPPSPQYSNADASCGASSEFPKGPMEGAVGPAGSEKAGATSCEVLPCSSVETSWLIRCKTWMET